MIEKYTALYSELDREYAQVMSGPYEDLGGQDALHGCVAGRKDGQITGFWRPVVVFGPEKYQQIWIKGLWDISTDIVYEDYLVDGALSPVSRFLLEKAYYAELHYVQVISLTASKEHLHRGLRKSYRSLVNRIDGVAQCSVDEVYQVHHAVRGVTRPYRTWEIQAAMKTVCFRDVVNNCAVMFYQGTDWAYYASAAGSNTHACIWAALMQLKANGVRYCEMGTQVFQGDTKAVGIATYKRGFGGRTKTRLILRRDTNG